MEIIDWRNCYSANNKAWYVPEAMSHPAKMAIGLCQRIFEFMEERGMLKEGEIVVDPFGDVFTTGLVGANRRFQVVGVELEEKFYRLARLNIEKHATMWNRSGRPLPFIFKGDSRMLSQIINQYASALSWYEVATRLCRVDDGLPPVLDRGARLKALGNAIVPQVAYEIMRAIKEIDDLVESPQV